MADVVRLATTFMTGSMTGGFMMPVVFATMLRRLNSEEARGTRVLVYLVVSWTWCAAMVFLLVVDPLVHVLSRSG